MLTLKLLGGLALASPDGDLGPAGSQRRPLALLAVIAASGGRGISREQAFLYLWPESNTRNARNTLNQTLYVIRRDLREPSLFVPGTMLRLNPSVVKCDHWGFEQALGRRELEHAVTYYNGPFLDQFSLPGVPEFERWVTSERSRLFERYYQALVTLAERSGERGDHRQAVQWWRMLSDQDPYSAIAAAGLISAHASGGDRTAALRFAKEYEARIQDELDQPVEPVVAQLVRHLTDASSSGLPLVTAFQVNNLLDNERSDETFTKSIRSSNEYPAEKKAPNNQVSARGQNRAQDALDFRKIVESAVDVIYLTDLAGAFTYTNQAGIRLLDLPAERIVGRLFIEFVREDFRQLLVDFYARQVNARTPVTYYEFPVLLESGKTFWLGQHVQIIERRGSPVGMLAIARDITLPKRLHGSQSYLSVRDSVTNLLNAAAFRVVVEHRIAISERTKQGFMLIFVRLEDVESTLLKSGAGAAEMVVTAVADAMRASFRKSDVIARIRPDKFAVVAVYALETDAEVLEARVQSNLARIWEVHPDMPQPRIRVTAAFYDPAMPPSVDALFASVAPGPSF